ncbi:hypothetical protein O0L34_g338 [Tuta absoluta]|nr:hypothetical protein O0L34_g338 [Tuta absoluta]
MECSDDPSDRKPPSFDSVHTDLCANGDLLRFQFSMRGSLEAFVVRSVTGSSWNAVMTLQTGNHLPLLACIQTCVPTAIFCGSSLACEAPLKHWSSGPWGVIMECSDAPSDRKPPSFDSVHTDLRANGDLLRFQFSVRGSLEALVARSVTGSSWNAVMTLQVGNHLP